MLILILLPIHYTSETKRGGEGNLASLQDRVVCVYRHVKTLSRPSSLRDLHTFWVGECRGDHWTDRAKMCLTSPPFTF